MIVKRIAVLSNLNLFRKACIPYNAEEGTDEDRAPYVGSLEVR